MSVKKITPLQLKYVRMGAQPADAHIRVIYQNPVKCAYLLAHKHKVRYPLIIIDRPLAALPREKSAQDKPVLTYIKRKYKKVDIAIGYCPPIQDSGHPVENRNGHKMFSSRKYQAATEERLHLILGTAVKYGHKHVVFGTWGISKGNPPHGVIQLFNKLLPEYDIPAIFFATQGPLYETYFQSINQR